MRAEDFLDGASSTAPMSAEDFLGPNDSGSKPPKQNTGIVGDIGTALKRGVLQMPGMATGLADIAAAPVSIATGVNRPVSRAADWLGEQTGFQPGKWAEAAGAEYSPEMQQAQQNVEQAKGFFPTLGAVAQNPRMILPVVGESLPATIAGGLVARGAMGAVAGAEKLAALRTAAGSADAAVANAARRELLKSGAIAAGVGEGAVTAGQQMAQTGYDVDPALAAGAAIGAGVGTGIIGGLSGRVAGSALGRKLGLSDIETSMAAGTFGENAGKAGAAGYAKRIGAGAIQEGLLEEAPQSYQEQVWQNLAAGNPLTEGAAEAAALGAVAGGVMGGSVNAISGPLSKAVAAAPAPTTAIDTVIPQPTTVIPANTVAPEQAAAGIASSAQFPQFTAPPQPVTGGAPLEQAPTAMPVPQATQNAPAAPGSPSPATTAELPSPANAAESAGAPVQQPQGPLPSANQTEVAIPSAQGPEAAALPAAAKPAKGIAAALQYQQQVTEGGAPLAQQAADMPLGRFGNRPKTADISPDISPDMPAKKATRIASSSGIASALVTPQQPTFGGAPLGQSPVAMPIGEYGKRAAVEPSQAPEVDQLQADHYRRLIASIEDTLRTGTTTSGKILTPERIKTLEQNLVTMKAKLRNSNDGGVAQTFERQVIEALRRGGKEPPIAPGKTRLYRAEPSQESDRAITDSMTGKFWTTDRSVTIAYGDRLYYVDVPSESVGGVGSADVLAAKDLPEGVGAKLLEPGYSDISYDVFAAIEDGDYKKAEDLYAKSVASRQTPPDAPQQPLSSVGAPQQPTTTAFDSDSFDKKRNETIKASRAAGNVHLDKLDASVEGMRGKTIFYVHNPQQRGVIRTVDNNGLVYVYWADQYSADRESASKVEEPNKSWLKLNLPYWKSVENKKTFVYQSFLHSGDLKDYAVEKPQQATTQDAPQQPLSGAGEQQTVDRLQSAYNEAKAKLEAIGPEPRKPSTERQAFGTKGKSGAPADVVAKYEASVKAYVSWKAKYNRLKKAEVETSNALFAAKKAEPQPKPRQQQESEIDAHNTKSIKSEQFAEALANESVGGNAGDGRSGVNITFDKAGKIVAIGNYQQLAEDVRLAIDSGKLRRATLLVSNDLRGSSPNKILGAYFDSGTVEDEAKAAINRLVGAVSGQERAKPRQQPQPAPIMRRDDLVGAIMRVTGGDGIASNMALTIAGDTAGRGLSKLRGLFTNRGTIDLGEVATRLREDEGFDVRDGEHLSELIRAASFGDTAVSMERASRDQDTAEEKRHRDYIRQNANKLKIKSVAVKFTDLEQRVIAALTRRHERAVELLDERAKKRFDAALEESYALLPEDVVDAVLVDVNGRGLKTLEFWKEATKLLRYMVADAKAQKEQEALNAIEGAEPDWLKDDDRRGNQPAGGRGEVDRVAEEARGEAGQQEGNDQVRREVVDKFPPLAVPSYIERNRPRFDGSTWGFAETERRANEDPSNWNFDGFSVELTAHQLQNYKNAVTSINGALLAGSKGASPTGLISSWSAYNILARGLSDWMANHPKEWADYKNRQSKVESLKIGDSVVVSYERQGTFDDGPDAFIRTIKKKNKVNWSLDKNGISQLHPPASLLTVEDAMELPKKRERQPDDDARGEAGFSLAAQTPEEIAAAEAAAKAAEAKADKEKKAAEDAQKKAELTAEVKKRSEAAADTFELGGNAMDNLTGQKDIFAAPASKIAKKNDEKPKTINDADIAIANGKVTGEILGYMKEERDAARLDELRAEWRQSFAGNHAETIAAADITRSDYEKLGDLIDRGGITSDRAAEMIDSAVAAGILDAKVAEYMKKKAIPTKPAAKEAINDFGEKLEGARKDYAAQMKDAMSVDVASEPLSKSWPEPDYQKLLDGGADPYMVAFVRAARDELPTKPQKSWKLAGWVKQAEMLRDMAQKLLSGNISVARLKEILSEARFGLVRESVGSRAELYELVGHKMSLKGVSFAQHFYSLYKGQENVRKWVVEQKAKATVFSNWPRELAVGDTKEEVLAAFKDKIASLDLGAGAKRQPQFVIYRKRGEPGAWVGKKIGREYIDLHKATDVAEARKYMAESLPALEAKLAKYKETPLERKADNQPRVGDDHRNGAPVTPEVFADTFGFRGVQFGNYVEQSRRQSDLNEAFDGLMDLAAVLGIPPRALSLNGQLGLAFGARGRGGKNAPAAHFETGRVVINLTKGGGPGSLAHEWWHSLDNYFAKQANKNSTEFVTAGARTDGVREAMRVAFNAVNMATSTKAYQARSAELDKRRSKPYWNTSEERSARAFEGYVIAKLFDQGAANDYLANVVSNEVWDITEDARAELFGEGKTPKTYPYPTVDEMPAVRAAFDEFFKTVETKDGEDGNVALFSFAGQQSATADQFQLDRAKQLLADGANANSVRQQTGWFKNPSDGKWRYEIDDSGASLKNMRMEDGLAMRATSLETILDHPALFAAYPALRDMDVQITIDPDGKEGGSFERGSAGDSKTFGRQPEIKVNARTEEKALSTLLHEIQHGIQNVEGFASGGRPEGFDISDAETNRLATQLRASQQRYIQAKATGADPYGIEVSVGAVKDELDRAKQEWERHKQASQVARSVGTYQAYRRLAGEVESRNVQQRQSFPADKRRLSDPLGTQDVAPEDVIVMFNGKDAKDAPAPFNTTRASAMAAVGASPADAAVFDMASEGKSAQEILAFLSKASRRPFNRVLAAALSRIGVDSTVSIDPAAGWRNNQGRNGAKFAASYSPKTDTVSLYTPREAERHILHELVHAATLKAIARGGPAARQMQAIFDYVQKTGTMSDQYGMGNFSRFPNETDAQFKKRALDEFTAELFTNPQFQVRLKQLQAPSGSKLKSAWDWIVRVIANLLGLKTKAQETALDRALSVGAALLQENAALTMPPAAGTRYHTTWHGSPHKFYTFDLSKIGTGEGAQAYGHGLYVAEAPEVAKDYQKNLSQFSRIYGNPIVGNKNISSGARTYLLAENADLQKAIQNARDAIVRRPDNELLPPILKELESLNPEAISKSSAGNFYKVDLPAEAVARMLDWDAGLHDNPMAVKIALEKDDWDTSAPDFDMDIDVMTGEDVIRELFDQLGSKQAVSDRLLSMGIVGTRYLDKDSRDKGKGTSNFVLFDDKLARIIEVNGVETGVQPWAPGEWEAAQGGERFSQEQPFSGREVAATPLKPGTKTLMVDGVERPALNSNGKPIHWSEEGIKNFYAWFKDSKAVDEQGRPMVVYHGSMTKGLAIESFDPNKIGTKTDDGYMGKGFYFGDSRTANAYSGHYEYDKEHFPQGGVIYPVYLSMTNPIVLQDRIESGRSVDLEKLARESTKLHESASSVDVREKLIGAGKDGAIYSRNSGYREYVVFFPEQVKSATANTGAFSEDPDIRYSLVTNWQQYPVAPGNLYQAAKKKAASLLTPERLDKVIYEMQDKFIDLRRIRDHIKEIGGTITDLNDAYLGEELYHKRLAYRTEQFLKEELQPFFADMKARGVEMPEFEKFLHARHAPEANDEMAKRNPNQKQIDAGRQKSAATVRALELNLQTAKARGLATVAIEKALNDARAELVRWNGAQAFKGTEAERLSLSGMSNADANALMASLTTAQRADMNALAAKVDAINEGTLQTLERYGLMDKAAMTAWRQTYKHYVPLHRDEAHPDSASHPIGQGFNVRGDASKRRTGSNQEVTNIFGHIVMQREAALTRGEKNRVMQKLYLMARQNPIADIWSVGKVPMIDTIDKATGFVRSVPDPQYKDKPNVITLRIGGKDVAIVMNEYNPQALRLAQSIKNLDVDDLHYLIPVVGKATRLFASINTQYNPIFGLINFARDVQTAALNLSTTAIAGKQKEVFKDTMSILGDIVKNKGRMPTAGKWAPIYKEFNEVGGTTGYRDLFLTAEDRSKAVTDEIKALDRGKVSQAAHAVAGWLSDYNEAMENATRLAAYKAAIDNGMSKERAASLAKNLTVNFNRKGRQTRELGALYAFFNAAVQGTARMAQTLSGPAGKKIMLGGVLAGAASAMAGIAAMGGGDGEDDEWSKIPEFVKERSLIIPSPFSKEGYFAIPMPLGFHFLPNIGRLMVEMAVYKDKTLGKQMASLFTVLADAFNPLGGSAPPMQIIAPTVMDPLIALAQNKDWTGKPIYVENFNSLNPQPGAARAKDSATPIAKGLSDAINAVTGGTKYVPGAWSPTPDQIDYVIGQLTGGVGRELGKLSSTISAPFTGDELPAHKIPLLGRLYGSTAGATGQAGKFYENIKRANEVENELKGRRKDGISVDDYLQNNPKAVELAARGNAAERQIRALRQMRSRIVEAGGDDAASKARQINERMATVMRGFNMQVERMQ